MGNSSQFPVPSSQCGLASHLDLPLQKTHVKLEARRVILLYYRFLRKYLVKIVIGSVGTDTY